MNLPTDLKQAIDDAKACCKNQYALTYLNNVENAFLMYGMEGVRVQLLYILSNTQYWRGEKARKAKLVFKKYTEKGALK